MLYFGVKSLPKPSVLVKCVPNSMSAPSISWQLLTDEIQTMTSHSDSMMLILYFSIMDSFRKYITQHQIYMNRNNENPCTHQKSWYLVDEAILSSWRHYHDPPIGEDHGKSYSDSFAILLICTGFDQKSTFHTISECLGEGLRGGTTHMQTHKQMNIRTYDGF